MNKVQKLLIKNGLNPSLLTEETQRKFEEFCLLASNSEDFHAFADSCVRHIESTERYALEIRERGKGLLKDATDIAEGISAPAENTLLSAFSVLTNDFEDKFRQAVLLLEAPIVGLRQLIAEYGNQNSGKLLAIETELTLRSAALGEFSSDDTLKERYRRLKTAFSQEENRLIQLKNETVLLLDKAIQALSALISECDELLSQNGRSQADFFALLGRHQLILHDIHKQL